MLNRWNDFHQTWQSIVILTISDSAVASDGVKAIASKAKTKAKAVAHKAKAEDKVINRDQGQRQGHDEPTQYHFLWRKYLPATNNVY